MFNGGQFVEVSRGLTASFIGLQVIGGQFIEVCRELEVSLQRSVGDWRSIYRGLQGIGGQFIEVCRGLEVSLQRSVEGLEVSLQGSVGGLEGILWRYVGDWRSVCRGLQGIGGQFIEVCWGLETRGFSYLIIIYILITQYNFSYRKYLPCNCTTSFHVCCYWSSTV